MSAPANIRVNTSVPFPSLVTSSGPITISKVNGVWIVGFSINNMQLIVPSPSNYATDQLFGFDTVGGNFFKMSLASLIASIGSISVEAFDTTAGTYTVTNETTLLINKTVPAAHNIQLPTAASRGGVPIVVKDYAGNAAANIATILPSGSERIDGLSSVPINTNYGGFRLVPIATGGWFISP